MQAAFDPAFGEAWNRRQVEDALVLGNCHYCLAQSNGETVGFYLSRHCFEEEELLLIAVHPRFRGRGFGQQLLDDLAEQAALRGARRLLLEMRRNNPAQALYRRNGFLPIGERLQYYRTPSGERLDAITFARDL